MKKSLWTAQYRTAQGNSTNGIVTLDNGRIHGGNALFYFIGEYNASNESRLTAVVKIKRYAAGESIFGPIDEAVLILSGSRTATHIFFSGYMENAPDCKFTAKMEKLADIN